MRYLIVTFVALGICGYAIAAEDNLAQAKATIERLCGEGKPGDAERCAKWQRSYDAAVKQKAEDNVKRAKGCWFKWNPRDPVIGEWICP